MIPTQLAKQIFAAVKQALHLYYINSTPYKMQNLGLAMAAREQTKRTITNGDLKAFRDALLKVDYGKDGRGQPITVEDLEVKLSKIYMPLNHTGFVLSAFLYLNEEDAVVGYQLSFDLHTRLVCLVPMEA